MDLVCCNYNFELRIMGVMICEIDLPLKLKCIELGVIEIQQNSYLKEYNK